MWRCFVDKIPQGGGDAPSQLGQLMEFRRRGRRRHAEPQVFYKAMPRLFSAMLAECAC